MIKAQRVGNTIVALIEGKMYQREFLESDERSEVFELLLNTDETKQEDIDLAVSKFKPALTEGELKAKAEFELKKAETQYMFDILDFMKEVKTNGHDLFEVIESSIYVKGIKLSIPELLIKEILKADKEQDDDRLSALLNFWGLCAMNPDPRARFDLFRFLVNHNLTLTPSGNFVAYRTVNVHKEGDVELEKFVTQEYLRVKRWKKSPKNYYVGYHNEGDLGIHLDKAIFDENLGNLDELYQNIGELSGNVYTDAHTGKFRIKMGEVVEMDRHLVDADNQNPCSRGLHLGNEDFMRANMGHFGKVGIVALVNPKDVTSVPEYDSGKMRTCKYLPIAIAETDENGFIIPVDTSVFEYEMVQNTQEEIDYMLGLNSTELEEYKKNEFIAPEVDFRMLNNIYENVLISLEDANAKIKDRVIKL